MDSNSTVLKVEEALRISQETLQLCQQAPALKAESEKMAEFSLTGWKASESKRPDDRYVWPSKKGMTTALVGRSDLEGSSAAVLLATECLSNSVTFITKFHEFIQRTYRDYLLHVYKTDAAWKLAASILDCLSEARAGARNPVVGDIEKQAANAL